MKQIIDLPVEAQKVALDFVSFVIDPKVGCLLPYQELINKFNREYPDQQYTVFINSDDPENDGYFDFEFGCLGGTFSLLTTGEAHLDVIQWYPDPDDDDDMPDPEEIKMVFKPRPVENTDKTFAEKIVTHLVNTNKDKPLSDFLPEIIQSLQQAFPTYTIQSYTEAFTDEVLDALVGRTLVTHIGIREDDNRLTIITITKGE